MNVNTVVKYYCAIFLFFVCHATAQNINTPENFPDPLFKLEIEDYMEVPHGGEFTAEEAASVTKELRIVSEDVERIDGIHFFRNLSSLYCVNDKIVSIDLSNNLGLKKLYLGGDSIAELNLSKNLILEDLSITSTQISTINVSGNTELVKLSIGGVNNVTSLDLSKNTKLQELSINTCNFESINLLNCNELRNIFIMDLCDIVDPDTADVMEGNHISHLDLSSCLQLERVQVSGNPLKTLNVSKNQKLFRLYCNNCELIELDVTNCPLLDELSCFRNYLTNIDVSENPVLKKLTLSKNNISSIDLSMNHQLELFRCNDNQISVLNINQCQNLEELYCNNNNILELPLDLPVLHSLYCSGNSLTELDLTHCHNMQRLYCDNNQIAELQFSPDSEMFILDCSQNRLTDINALLSNPLLDQYWRISLIDICNNNLDNGDWDDVSTLKEILTAQFNNFYYSPQNGLDPYDGTTSVDLWDVY